MKIVIILGIVIIAVSVVNSITTSNSIINNWIKFDAMFNVRYKTSEEYQHRKNVFTQNFKLISNHNELYELGLKSHELGINAFSDLTYEELVLKMNGFRKVDENGIKNGIPTYSPPKNIQVPDEIDYRTKGYVTPVRNQGSCAASWAFSATGAIEGQVYRALKMLIPLSVQNLIDCTIPYGNRGCGGGNVYNAFAYFQEMGINSEMDYPYEFMNKTCRFYPRTSIGKGQGYMKIGVSEATLKMVVGTFGPVSAAIDASNIDFIFYKSGIYFNENCSSSNVNLAVLIVGYGTDLQGRDYWIVKNSWGTEWGDNGYVLMSRNRNNHCGIATMVSLPLFDSTKS